MQTVDIDLLPNPIFKSINALYADISEPKEEKALVPYIFDSSFETLFDILEAKVPWFKRYETETLPIPKLTYPYNPKDVVVCVSGGKDSVAAVLHYIQLGFNV